MTPVSAPPASLSDVHCGMAGGQEPQRRFVPVRSPTPHPPGPGQAAEKARASGTLGSITL